MKKKNLFEMFNAINSTNLNTMVEKEKLYDGITNIDETNLNRILGLHFNAGLIIISSNRHKNTHEKNKSNFEQLKNDLKKSKFSYFPVYGGFIEKSIDGEKPVEVIEPAFIVANYQIASSTIYDNTGLALKQFGIKLSQKYNQESFLFVPPKSDKYYYITPDGNVDMSFSGVGINDITREYFTRLNKYSSSNHSDQTEKRFTLVEKFYLNESPKSISSACLRYGEVFYK